MSPRERGPPCRARAPRARLEEPLEPVGGVVADRAGQLPDPVDGDPVRHRADIADGAAGTADRDHVVIDREVLLRCISHSATLPAPTPTGNRFSSRT